MWSGEITEEEEEEIIKKIGDLIIRYDLVELATIMVTPHKPLSNIYAQFSRMLVFPFSIFFGIEKYADKYFTFLEKPENIDKLIQ